MKGKGKIGASVDLSGFMDSNYPAEGGGDGGDLGSGDLGGGDAPVEDEPAIDLDKGSSDAGGEGLDDSIPAELRPGYVAPEPSDDDDPAADDDGGMSDDDISALESGNHIKPDIAKNMRNMRKIIGSKNETIASNAALIAQLKEAGVLGDDNKVLDSDSVTTLKGELNEAYDKLGQYNLMDDPRFKQTYDAPINAEADALARLVVEFTDTEEKDALGYVNQLIRMAPKERIAAIHEYMPDAGSYAAQHLMRIDAQLQARGAALKTHADTKQSMDQRSVVEEQGRVAEYKHALQTQTFDELEADGVRMFGHIPGNDKFNAFSDMLRKDVDDLVNADAPTQTKAMAMGRAMPVYRKMLDEQVAENKTLRDELSKYRKTVVRPAGSPEGNGGVPAGVDVNDNDSIIKMLASRSA